MNFKKNKKFKLFLDKKKFLLKDKKTGIVYEKINKPSGQVSIKSGNLKHLVDLNSSNKNSIGNDFLYTQCETKSSLSDFSYFGEKNKVTKINLIIESINPYIKKRVINKTVRRLIFSDCSVFTTQKLLSLPMNISDGLTFRVLLPDSEYENLKNEIFHTANVKKIMINFAPNKIRGIFKSCDHYTNNIVDTIHYPYKILFWSYTEGEIKDYLPKELTSWYINYEDDKRNIGDSNFSLYLNTEINKFDSKEIKKNLDLIKGIELILGLVFISLLVLIFKIFI